MALCDSEGLIAHPLMTFDRSSPDRDAKTVVSLVQEYQSTCVVVGIPLSMSGDEGPQARAVRGFVRLLRLVSPVLVETWDERLSTVQAERLLHEAGVQPTRNKSRVDAAAAAIILQAWVDAHRRAT